MILGAAGAVLALAVLAAVAMKPSDQTEGSPETHFSIADYRVDASRLTGNTYRLSARVENIESIGNDRLVAVSVPGNSQERLPLLVRSGASGRVNLTRGDSFVFHVVCRNGKDDQGLDVKGVMLVDKVETE